MRALATLVSAYLSYRFVEEPVRRARPPSARPKQALQLGLVCMLVGMFSGMGLLAPIWTAPSTSTASVRFLPAGDAARMAGAPRFGAQVLRARPLGDPLGAAVNVVASITPNLRNAKQDFDKGCAITGAKLTQVRQCAQGIPSAKKPHLLVLGDSHAHQWIPALKAIARAKGYSLTAHLKVSCPFIKGQVFGGGGPYTRCTQWNRNVRRALTAEARPDLVILTSRKVRMMNGGRVLTGRANTAKLVKALRAAVREFTSAGIPVAVIRDTPTPKVNIPDCIASHRKKLTTCATPRAQALRGSEQLAAIRGVKGAHRVDLTNAICPRNPCAAVIGGVMVWRDGHHLTRTYVRSLTPRLQRLIVPLVTNR